jgi:predicted phage baseplate assembly protein
LLGKGLEEPLQEVSLQPAPVQSHSVEIFTLADEQWQTWSWRPDFETSSRCDRHFLLDETAGKVTFGDGEKGLPAPKDALIFARFRATTAEKGNVLAGKISRLSRSAHNQALIDETAYSALVTISNPYDATGGAAKESLAHAEGRALQEVYRVTRAVTISDIEQLALTTPGTCIARVAVKANLDARYPCLLAPGVTTVILLPQISARAAQPSAGLRAAVRSYLDRRRILGNRIEVLGPVYTKVTVQARVQSETDANASRVRQDILRALDDFFHPLYGGPEGSGWPFGRDIYRSEVLHVIDGVAGVENVVGLELIANEGEPSCGNLCIGPCGLVISGEHEITVD